MTVTDHNSFYHLSKAILCFVVHFLAGVGRMHQYRYKNLMHSIWRQSRGYLLLLFIKVCVWKNISPSESLRMLKKAYFITCIFLYILS